MSTRSTAEVQAHLARYAPNLSAFAWGLVSELLRAQRAETLREAADWLGSLGEASAAYLLHSVDVAGHMAEGGEGR